jgi:predicted nucleotidyltransferase
MAKLQKEFGKFHEEIKLKKFDENKDLREKRDLLFKDLGDGLKDEKIPNTTKKLTFREINQGSYVMNTGIKPQKEDYDIDIGAVFNITNDEYNSAELKKLVRDKLNKGNRTVVYNRPCLTVEYKTEDYHVDLAVYSENNDDIHIAWGKEFANEKIWYKSEPEKLTTWVSDVSTVDNESAQFRRSVRYLKKWKEKHFSASGNNTPPSIGLTIQARKAFSDNYAYSEKNDLDALIRAVTYIKNSFQSQYDPDSEKSKKGISILLPVEPYKNVYYKMSLIQQDNFYNKICDLLELLENVDAEESDYEASKLLQKIFGTDFPLANDTRASEKAPYVTTGQNA